MSLGWNFQLMHHHFELDEGIQILLPLFVVLQLILSCLSLTTETFELDPGTTCSTGIDFVCCLQRCGLCHGRNLDMRSASSQNEFGIRNFGCATSELRISTHRRDASLTFESYQGDAGIFICTIKTSAVIFSQYAIGGEKVSSLRRVWFF